MPDPATATTVGGAKIAVDIYKLAKELGWMDKLKSFWKKKRKIIVLGSTGAGKTQFIESMQTLIPQLILNTDRTAFNTSTMLSLGNTLFKLTDTPGQIGHEGRRMEAIADALKDAEGVINVVSFGYHEFDVSANEAITKEGAARQSFLKANRENEMAALDEWTGKLSLGLKNPWLITLATKADLWWDQREAVKAHYETGPYHQWLGDAQDMKPTVCLYSSIRHRFFDRTPLCGHFDDTDRLRLRENFFRVLFEAIGNPKGNR